MAELKELNKQSLLELFHKAHDEEKNIQIELTVPGSDVSEVIITKNANLRTKLDYYISNYDEELKLIRNPEIKMLSIKVIDWKD